MSDCSSNAWHVPEQREPGVLYMHGQPGTDYAAVQAIEVDGRRFERVIHCKDCRYEYKGECLLPSRHGDYRREYVGPDSYCSDGKPRGGERR